MTTMSTNLTADKLLPPLSSEGIDLQFTDETLLEQDFSCNICLRVMYTPTETPCAHAFCKTCIKSWLHRDSVCPLCRRDVKPYQLHTSTYLQRKIGQLHVQCEFKCGTAVQWQHYTDHRYKQCSVARLLQHYIEFCSGTVDDSVISDIAHVNDIPIKLLMHIADQLHLDRSNCIEKSDLTGLLFRYAEQQHSLATQTKRSKIDPMYDYTDWSSKQLKTALRLKHVPNVENILERGELETLCRQNFILRKPNLKPVAQPVKPANYAGNANNGATHSTAANTHATSHNTFNINHSTRSAHQSHSRSATDTSQDHNCSIL